MLACCLLARRKAGDSRGTSNRARKERAVARLGSLGRSRGGVARSSGRPYLLSFQFTCSSRRTCTTSKKVCNFKGVERGWGERLCEPGRGSSARDVLEVLCRLVRACARAPTQSVLAFGPPSARPGGSTPRLRALCHSLWFDLERLPERLV